MSVRIRTSKTLLAASAIAAALTLAAVTPALAGGGAAPAGHRAAPAAVVSTVQGDPRNVTQRVADFYGAYIDSVWDLDTPGASTDAKALRAFYLTDAARRKVAAFEAREHADGILFAQNVPVKWKVVYTGSGMGHATSRVTLTWSDGKNPEVTAIDVQSDLRTRRITDLKPAG
ncbi:hypothetical protein [Streptomyces tropicalis]|uniref:Nuclear transport factor 2 family protein n=1 Tax=Streptomyces tropicalis TaxID=3034234 RepID=A0ABT6ACH1_9ACTN|nr:hypothetical protein [Streptomyces tropicalis]MDF3301520.1 hypothetical protein [Streptomyces tropicalis]